MPKTIKDFFGQRYGWRKAGALMLALLLVAGILAAAPDAFALRVTMKRVIFEGPKRTELLTIVNNTGEEQSFRLGWRNMRMTEDHSLVFVKEGESLEGLHPAEEMVRFSPRRVVLAPGASQQIRLMLRRPKDLAEGEYRSHFWIQPEAPATKFTPDQAQKPPKGSSVQIKMLTGMTVPVFVRNGNLAASVAISDVSTAPDPKGGTNVKMTIRRDGNRSVYGDLKFFCANGGGKPQHEVKGIAVYTDVTARHLDFTVPNPEGASCAGPIRIQYTSEEDDSQFKGAVMAEASTGG